MLVALLSNRKARARRWRHDRSGDAEAGFMFKCMMCGAQTHVRKENPPVFKMNTQKTTYKKRGHPKEDRACRITQVIQNTLDSAFHHHLFDFGNRFSWIQTLWTGFRAVHDCMAAIQFKWIFQFVQTFACGFITAVNDPAIGMQERRWPKIPITVPPI